MASMQKWGGAMQEVFRGAASFAFDAFLSKHLQADTKL